MKAFSGLTALLTLIFPALSRGAECSRDVLIAGAGAYLTAQSNGSPTSLTTSATYQQNNKVMSITDQKSILKSPLKIDYNRTTTDLVACASYTMYISTSGSKPYVISTQITHDANSSSVKLYDTVVATTGDLFFDATKTLGYIQKEDWTEITNVTQRPSRELLKKVGDAYLDMWTDAKAADSIPWGTQCERVEGSQYTNPCGKSLPRGGSKKANGMRRYVIDESKGSVDVLCQFDSLGAWPDSHEIRLIDGKVKYVHTVTVTRGVGV